MRCKAKARSTGKRCTNYSMPGTEFCRAHTKGKPVMVPPPIRLVCQNTLVDVRSAAMERLLESLHEVVAYAVREELRAMLEERGGK